MLNDFFLGPARKRRLWLSLGLGALSTLVGWLLSLRYPGDPSATAWYAVVGGASLILACSLLASEIAPPAGAIPPLAETIPREVWEALATTFAVLTILVTSVLPFILIIYGVVTRPQTAKSLIPLAFILVGMSVGVGVSWLSRSKELGVLGTFGIVGTSVTIFSALGFAIAELL